MFGYQIGLNNDDIYVAVPQKYFDGPGMDGLVNICCDGQNIMVTAEGKTSEATFKDKFHPGENYTLYYYLWSKTNE